MLRLCVSLNQFRVKALFARIWMVSSRGTFVNNAHTSYNTKISSSLKSKPWISSCWCPLKRSPSIMTMLNRAHCLSTSPDILKGIFLKLKHPENLINSTITRFIESRNQQVRDFQCTRSNYSAVQGSKISRRCTKTAVRSWKENKQRSTPSFYKQENCRRHQRSRGQTTVNKSTMRCL